MDNTPVGNLETIKQIVSECEFGDWIFRVEDKTGETPFVQVQFWDTDIKTGERALQNCRKWQLSYHMVKSEIPRTVHKAVMAAMEHEVNEKFKYKGVAIYNPHFDLNALVEFAKLRKISVRA